MKIKIPEALFLVAKPALSEFVNPESYKWRKFVEIDLRQMLPKRIERLAAVCRSHPDVLGVPSMLRDLGTWSEVQARKAPVARTVEKFTELLITLLRGVPGHRVYRRERESGVLFAYYVNEIEFHERARDYRNDREIPAYCSVELLYEELGTRLVKGLAFGIEACSGKTAEKTLLGSEFFVETPVLRAQYLAERARYYALYEKVGLQCLARGLANDDLDGNEKRRKDSWFWRSAKNVVMDKGGDPSRVVIDVFYESESAENGGREAHVNEHFWVQESQVTKEDDEEELSSVPIEKVEAEKDKRAGLSNDDLRGEIPLEPIEVPIHPMMAVFCLKRHLRLRVHVSNLTEYIYDRSIKDRLILPREVRELVEMLIAHRGGFTDIIAGKGGGSTILSAGPPGVGKTLTAEVYAEAMERPLYSVQCSQLGTTPDDLEEALLKVFARSQRWSAILLLDEADVYVACRGNDMKQNAIVGVFLRVLEYYNGVLFMTTNRADKVDDAVASRCIARIDYTIPTKEDQKRIWRVLADGAGIELSDKVISEIVSRHPTLSGRDVKNLLKLSMMVCASKGTKLDADVVSFVQRFKPTSDADGGAKT